MKNKSYILAMLAMSGMMSTSNRDNGRQYDPLEVFPKKKPIPNGCKEYTFYGNTVIAINEKSARKKCKKLSGK